MGRSFGLEEVAAEVEADEGVSARDGDGEWRPRRRDSGVAGAGEWRMGGGDPGGEDGGGGAVMRVIDGDEGECSGTVGSKMVLGPSRGFHCRPQKNKKATQHNTDPTAVMGPSSKRPIEPVWAN